MQDNAISSKTVHRCCPLCGLDGGSKTASHHSREGWLIQECANCQFVYLQNALDYSQLSDSHAWTRLFAAESDQRRQREPWFSAVSQAYKAFRLRYLWVDKAPGFIQRYVTGQRVLDVGCGTGFLLQKLPSRFKPFGIEIDSDAAAIAQRLVASRGGRVIQMDALTGLRSFRDAEFDGMLMHSYLEHENHPLTVLAEACRVLRPQGRLIVKVPNFASLNRHIRGSRWCGFRFPDHVNYFTPRTLAQMVRQAGLTIFRFGVWDKQPTSDNMWLIAERPRSTLNQQKAA